MKIDITYDHDKNNFVEAIGVTEKDYTVATATIIYETICPNLHASSLYDREEDVPDSFRRTKSMVLMNSLSHFQEDGAMTAIVMLTFEKTHDKALDQFKELNTFLGQKDSESNRIQASSIEDAIKQVVSKLKLMPMVEMVKALKDGDFDYDKFIKFILDQEKDDDDDDTSGKDYSDIDALIKKAMEDMEDDEKE